MFLSEQKDTPAAPPLVGVFVSGITIYNLQNQVTDHSLRLLVEANRQVNLNLYYFSLRGIYLRERKISGIYWDEQKNIWLPGQFEFPDVLYLRGGTINREFYIFLMILKNRKAKIINFPTFNKWHLYLLIRNDQFLQNFLPATAVVNNTQDIQKMLHEYKTVYLKPHKGRQGKYVLRVEVISHDRYLCSYYKHNQNKAVAKTVFGFQPLLEGINKFFQGKKFLVQQAIDLISYGNRLIDMRAELQRNGHGNLEIAGISVRMAQENSPITIHGDAYRIDQFYKEFLHYSDERMEKLQDKINTFLFRIYECVEKKYGAYAEIGIDFAVDIYGKIWFIECNSQSRKRSLIKAYGEEVLFKIFKNILAYIRYISNEH